MSVDAPQKTEPLESDIAAMAFVESALLFQGLDPEQLALLHRAGRVQAYAPQKTVSEEGGTDDFLFLILDGSVSVQKRLAASFVELAALERQAIFGEMSVLTRRPRSASVVTRTDVRLVVFPGEVIRAVADLVPKFGRKLAALMAGRTKDTEKKLGA